MIASFNRYCDTLAQRFLAVKPTKPTQWQALDVSHLSHMAPRPLWHESFEYAIPSTPTELALETEANLPWAEDHFQERVCGLPLNPPPSEQWWPYAQEGNKQAKMGRVFSHTDPERFWPKEANPWDLRGKHDREMWGIRFKYGDLDDVVTQLTKDPQTRQAYLPIFFPEDTGAVHGERVPCTLGYQFNYIGDKLHITYFIRSCDFMRHFRDDVYMAGRLAHYIRDNVGVQISGIVLTMHIVNFHVFEGDVPQLKNLVKDMGYRESVRIAGLL